jgi:predicted permease
MKAQMTPRWDGLDDPADRWVQLVGRLKPGMSRRQAEAGLQATYRPLLEATLPRMGRFTDAQKREFLQGTIQLLRGGGGRAVLRKSYGKPLLSLMAMVGVVLLIACSNLAGLLAARGVSRRREYGIRLAIGASGGQLLRQSVIECLVFTLAGALLGLVVASWTLSALLSAFPPDADLRLIAVSINPRVIGFAGGLAVLAAVVFGVGPAYRASRLDPAATLQGQGRSSGTAGREAIRLRGWLVTAQVALTLVLLVAAGMFAKSLSNLGRVNLGIKPENIVEFTIAPEANGYTTERTAALASELSARLTASPGVRSVSAAIIPAMAGNNWTNNIHTSTVQDLEAWRNFVGPTFFSTLGIPLSAGREFRLQDDPQAAKVAIVNETMARRLFPGKSAIGERVAIGRGSNPPDIEIVGVVADSKSAGVNETIHPFLFQPYLQEPKIVQLTFYVRSEIPSDRLTATVRSTVEGLDPDLPVFDVKTLTTQIRESLLTDRLMFALSFAFGSLAALLAAIGIYGVLAFSVAERRREIGVRMALGADASTVRRLVLSEVGRFLLVGGALGLPAAYLLARIIESILFGVKAADPLVFAAGAALMVAVALLAGYFPARRAARTDPIDALRGE